MPRQDFLFDVPEGQWAFRPHDGFSTPVGPLQIEANNSSMTIYVSFAAYRDATSRRISETWDCFGHFDVVHFLDWVMKPYGTPLHLDITSPSFGFTRHWDILLTPNYQDRMSVWLDDLLERDIIRGGS